jgi:hypothetical protein
MTKTPLPFPAMGAKKKQNEPILKHKPLSFYRTSIMMLQNNVFFFFA